MKKILLFATAASLAYSCGTETSYSVTGAIEGTIEGDTISLITYDRESKVVAQGVVEADSTFTITGNTEQPQMVVLSTEDGKRAGALFLEAGDITVEKQENGYIFRGSQLNDASNSLDEAIKPIFDAYAKITNEDSQEKRDSIISSYNKIISSTIDENLDNIFGANLFASIEFNELTAEQAKSRVAEFTESVQASPMIKELAATIEAMLNTEVGDQYIDINLPTKEGENVSVKNLLANNEYILIDFWATWCGPCRGELPHLKEAYDTFHEKGFEIYGVSVDQNRAAWESFVGEQMPWVNVIVTEQSDAADLYAVRTIPSNFLINKKGEIIAKNLRGEEVIAKMKELLK